MTYHIAEPRISVLLVDKEVVIRARLRLLIDSWPTLKVVGEADSPGEAPAAMDAAKPNLIVCSYTLNPAHSSVANEAGKAAGTVFSMFC